VVAFTLHTSQALPAHSVRRPACAQHTPTPHPPHMCRTASGTPGPEGLPVPETRWFPGSHRRQADRDNRGASSHERAPCRLGRAVAWVDSELSEVHRLCYKYPPHFLHRLSIRLPSPTPLSPSSIKMDDQPANFQVSTLPSAAQEALANTRSR
jgi:hypothetical protein